MDFPVTAEFAASCNPAQLHDAARGASPEWPACVVQRVPDDPASWAYHVDTEDVYVEDDPETGEPIERTRPREGVVVDAETVQAAIDDHVPVWPDPEPTVKELMAEISALRAQLGNS